MRTVSRVLVVEPHRDIRSLLEIVIARLGHEAVVYDGAEERLSDVDAAVIDPGKRADLLLAQRLRARCVPTILTSIFPPEREALDLGPIAYLVKPFPLYALEDALAAALEHAAHLCSH